MPPTGHDPYYSGSRRTRTSTLPRLPIASQRIVRGQEHTSPPKVRTEPDCDSRHTAADAHPQPHTSAMPPIPGAPHSARRSIRPRTPRCTTRHTAADTHPRHHSSAMRPILDARHSARRPTRPRTPRGAAQPDATAMGAHPSTTHPQRRAHPRNAAARDGAPARDVRTARHEQCMPAGAHPQNHHAATSRWRRGRGFPTGHSARRLFHAPYAASLALSRCGAGTA